MSMIKSFFESARKTGAELRRTLDEFYEEAREMLISAIEELSAEFWARVEDLEGCTECGSSKEQGKGWVYREEDYKFYGEKGKLEVSENKRELLCEKCVKQKKGK